MKHIRRFIAKRKANGRPATNTAPQAPSNVNRGAQPAPALPAAKMATQQQERQVIAEAAPGTLTIALQNRSSSSQAYAYITGLALYNNNRPIFIESDGRTVYSPESPSQTLQALSKDVAIPLGPPGNTVYAVIPKIAGGRIWFCFDGRLTFLVNPGPAIVEPSVTNFSDPSINAQWGFCEFTYNDAQLFANISYVDFIGVPIGMSLTNTSGQTQTVPGMPANGLDTIVNELRAQASRDKRPWDKLIYSANGRPLRVLSPNNLLVGNPNAWNDYWDAYVQEVWDRFSRQDMIINTQAAAGNLRGRVKNGELEFPEAGSFSKPSARDIFSCSTGPFATGPNAARNAVIPRLAAAFNRSTLLEPADQFPNGQRPQQYYRHGTTNHYSRIVHSVQKDGRGYAFPYDDVVPDGGQDVAGTMFDGSPKLWTVFVGGN